MSKIVVIGSVNVDKTTKLHHLPKSGETILGEDATESCGGKGANQAYAAAKLGADVTMLGVVGNDADGQKSLENLKSVGVHVDHMLISDKPTGSAVILVTDRGENMIVVMPGSNMHCSVEYLKGHQDIIKNAEIILLQLEIPMESVKYVLANKGEKTLIILDPAPYNEQLTYEDLQKVDILTPNETEFQYLTGKPFSSEGEELLTDSQKLMTSGPKRCIVTLGEKGGYVLNKDGYTTFDPVRIQEVDSTAAGDTFNGALASRLAKGEKLDVAINWAKYAAAVSVTRLGAQNSIPSEAEVGEFIAAKALAVS